MFIEQCPATVTQSYKAREGCEREKAKVEERCILSRENGRSSGIVRGGELPESIENKIVYERWKAKKKKKDRMGEGAGGYFILFLRQYPSVTFLLPLLARVFGFIGRRERKMCIFYTTTCTLRVRHSPFFEPAYRHW